MGCGLRKLEDPEDSSPGKIYSTLKRPQVESKTETVYEYVLLDFSLEGSRPTVQYVASLSELPQALQPYYTQGYVLTALHPIILSVGRTRSLPFSLLYRAILARPRPSNGPRKDPWGTPFIQHQSDFSLKQMASMCHSVPMLKVEEWPLPGDSLTGDTVRALIDRVNSSARGGVRFVGSVLQQTSGITNGRVHSPKRGCRSPPHTPPGTPPGDRELEENTYSPDLRLLVFFHSWAPGCAPLDSLACQYHQGALSMRVSRKGQVVSSLEADWLELTAAYYRKGWSLVDSFVYWDTPKGEPVPRSLEGLFVYEERSTCPPANDTIVVEQWTVIEGSNVKTDYGPLLHTLAEFGWLLTCVLPTPIIRHDSDGNLATKQVVFLQRPVRGQAAGQPSNQALSLHSAVSSRSVSRAISSPVPPEELSPTAAGGIAGFPVFGGGYPSAMSHLEEGGFEQEEGKAEVTCM
ncbi:raftlin-2 isoform X1 [Micropterus dolomieu]|uniref:raftlin-2 isoform X1 n=1 Tax=Micropterus dolomieu TaxID=147949 RepID=UPI001E8EECB9|nr:raftlin-2 isoform X1 [Micropterus dolomieu]